MSGVEGQRDSNTGYESAETSWSIFIHCDYPWLGPGRAKDDNNSSDNYTHYPLARFHTAITIAVYYFRSRNCYHA